MTISNNDLKKYSSLNRKNKRKEHQLFVVEGEKICKELIKTDLEYESIFTTKDIQNEFPQSTVLFEQNICLYPNQSRVLIIVPKFPGSLMLSRKINGFLSLILILKTGILHIATTLHGLFK